MNLSIVIKTCPQRAAMLADLQERIGPLPTVCDDGRGAWQTSIQCWESAPADCEYHMVLEDDALPCAGFRSLAAEAIDSIARHRPEMVNFFCRLWPRSLKAIAKAGAPLGPWLRMNCCNNGVAAVMRRDLIPSFLAWCEENVNPAMPSTDQRYSLWLLKTGRTCWLSQPSLVEHRGDASVYQTEPKPIRRAAWFIGQDGGALDWRTDKAPPVLRVFKETAFDRHLLRREPAMAEAFA